jgi:hypothetical protein
MGIFSPVGSVKLNIPLNGAKTRQTQNVSMPVANTEYSFTLPAGTTQFSLHPRLPSTLTITDTSGGLDYYTVFKGCGYSESNLLVDTGGLTLYIKSDIGSNVLEIVSWS